MQYLNEEEMEPNLPSGTISLRTYFVSSADEHNITKSWPPKRAPYGHVIHKQSPKLSQGFLERAPLDDLYLKQGVFSTPAAYDFHYSLRFSDKKAELLSSANPMQKHVSDSESVNMGNLENKEEWLEQVEEAAKIAIPQWEDWDRGQRMLPAMIPCEASCSKTTDMVSDREAYYPGWEKVEEPELATACRMLDASISDSFSETILSDEGKLEGVSFSTRDVAELNTDRFRTARAAGSVTPVGACAGTATNRICVLGRHPSVFWQDIETVDLMDNLFSLTDACRSNSATPKTTCTHLLSAGSSRDTKTVVQNKSFYSNTSLMTEVCIDKDLRVNKSPCHSNGKSNILENENLHLGKFLHNHLLSTLN